jgi:DNA-binding transcriptional MerR regulator
VKEYLRPVDLARAVGMSAQTVRKYEAWGFLPPAARSPAGYRLYSYRHLHAIEAARAMIAGYGWQSALRVMRLLHEGDLDAALAVVDARHAALDRGRREVGQTLDALRTVAGRRDAGARAPRSAGLRVGEAARRAGVRVSALRFWEEQGLLHPRRDDSSRYRLYDEQQLRRLQVVVLLREAGYGFDAIRAVLGELAAGRPERALRAVERRRDELARISRARAAATAAFWTYATAARSAVPPPPAP